MLKGQNLISKFYNHQSKIYKSKIYKSKIYTLNSTIKNQNT